MKAEKINKYLKECFVWNFTDFFYAYCEAKGINDPETDLTEEEYNSLEKKCEKKISYQFLSEFVNNASEIVNSEIVNAMETL